MGERIGERGGRGSDGLPPFEGVEAGGENVRAADLVGAIAGEAKLPPRVIGSIEIADCLSLVDVPGDVQAKDRGSDP